VDAFAADRTDGDHVVDVSVPAPCGGDDGVAVQHVTDDERLADATTPTATVVAARDDGPFVGPVVPTVPAGPRRQCRLVPAPDTTHLGDHAGRRIDVKRRERRYPFSRTHRCLF
jgi:hypothetical protein